MALVDTGIRQKTDHGEIATVTDMRGHNVLIDASKEALVNFGWDRVLLEAIKKYDAGDIEAGNPPKVTVVNGDFEID